MFDAPKNTFKTFRSVEEPSVTSDFQCLVDRREHDT
jgi:hypothetical protein